MLDARVSPIASVLTNDPKVILRATGILSRLWRLTLGELKIGLVKWRLNLDDYIDRCKEENPGVDFSNVKGNLGKALARDEVTWDVFCKGVSLLKLKNPRLTISMTLGKKTEEVDILVPFTAHEDRGPYLSKAWMDITASFKERHAEWDTLISDYGLKQKKLGMNLADSLKSNLTNTLKTKSIMWAVLIRGIEVLNFDKVKITLSFDAVKGRKEIVLNPK